MRVVITGINGLLGKDIGRVFSSDEKYEVYGLGRAECLNKGICYRRLDLTDQEEVKSVLAEIRPELIIHCAAYTKLDDCEKNHGYAKLMNVDVTGLLAEQTSRFVYISSDAVFSGDKGNYKEEDASDAINYYGHTKYLGEKAALKNQNSLVIRSSIYGFNTNENQSIAEWGARNLSVGKSVNGFTDVIFNPLYSWQLAQILLELVKNDCKGVLHLGSDEVLSKFDFFRLLARELNVDEGLVNPVSVDSIEFLAKRTKNTSLNVEKMSELTGRKASLATGIKQLVADMRLQKRF